jgi:hypothetical protein
MNMHHHADLRPPGASEFRVGQEVWAYGRRENPGKIVRRTDAGFFVDFWNRPDAALFFPVECLSAEPLLSAQIDGDDPEGAWTATLGARMKDARTGRLCTVSGWTQPRRWDDERDRYVPCDATHPEAIFARVTVLWDGGEETEEDGIHLRGADWEAPPPPPPPLEFLSYDEMADQDEPRWIVEGLIQTASSALLFGPSNSFKSFLGVDIACSVATGTSWHGCDVLAGPVLYVATEGARGVGARRVPGWMDAHGILADRRRGVFLYPGEIALDDPKAVDALISSVKHYTDHAPGLDWLYSDTCAPGWFALIVVDIFGGSMNGSEVTDETARAWVRSVNRIMDECCGTSVLTIAHTGWADQTRARMHTHFWGSFDTRMKAEGDKDALTTVLRIDRHKDADSRGEWGFRLEETPTPQGGTTLVPRLADDIAAGQKRRVSGKPLVALQALSEALIEHGQRIAGPSFPARPVVGAQAISIDSGAVEWPVVTSSVTAGWAASETGNVAGPEVYATTDRAMKPDHNLGVQVRVTRRALKQSGAALEAAIRRDMGGAMGAALDKAVFLGTGASGQPLGVIQGAATYGITATAIGAAATWAAFRAAITRFMLAHAAGSPGAVRLLIRPEIWAALDAAENASLAKTEWQRLAEQVSSIAMSSNALAAPTGSPLATSALLTTSAGGVAPIFVGLWGAVDMIRDPYSDAQSGGLRITALATADVTVARPVQLEVLTGLRLA